MKKTQSQKTSFVLEDCFKQYVVTADVQTIHDSTGECCWLSLREFDGSIGEEEIYNFPTSKTKKDAILFLKRNEKKLCALIRQQAKNFLKFQEKVEKLK